MTARLPTALVCVAVLALAGCTGDPATGDPATGGPTSGGSPTVSAGPDRPRIGAWHHLVYDPKAGGVVLVNGGPEQGHPADAPLELWRWDGRAWSRLDPAAGEAPRWRNFAAVAYDTDRSVLIVTGGLQGRGQPLDETWEWDGQRWRRFAADGPGGREGARLAYDPARRVAVLFGGVNAAGASDGTWGWDGAAWRRLAGAGGPSARFPGLLEYDPAHRTVVLFGGHPRDGPVALGDTWLWNGTRWRAAEPPTTLGPRFNAAATFHPGLGRVIQVAGADGGGMYGDVWGWDGTTWRPLPVGGLPPRQAAGLAYDAARDRLVLTGGLDRPGTAARLQDVWESDGTRFTQVLP